MYADRDIKYNATQYKTTENVYRFATCRYLNTHSSTFPLSFLSFLTTLLISFVLFHLLVFAPPLLRPPGRMGIISRRRSTGVQTIIPHCAQ